MSAMKRCTGPCGETKPLDAFRRDRSRRDGRQSWCRVCVSARQAALFAERVAGGLCGKCSAPAVPGRTLCRTHAAAHAAWQAANPEKVAAYSAASKRTAYATAKAEGRCVWRNGCAETATDGVLCPDHRAEQATRDVRRSARQTAAMLTDCAEWDVYRCHLCELPILPDDEMHRDHLVPENHGGGDRCETTGTTMLRPAHAFCNVSRKDEHILVAVSRLNPSFTEGA